VHRYLPLTTACVLVGSGLWGCSRPGASDPRPGAAKSPAAAVLRQGLDISSPALTQLTEAELPVLQRYLAASAGWKLTRMGAMTVAVRREPADESTPEAGKLRMTPDGFYFKHQPWRRYRALIRFGAAPLPVEKEWEAIRTEGAAADRDLALTVVPAQLPDYRSYLVVRSAAPVAVEIMEESMDTSRDTTRRLLREVSAELAKALKGTEQIRKQGFLPGVTPKPSITAGPAVLKVEPAPAAGAWHLVGYVNPAMPGLTYARLLDASGKPLAPEVVRDQTLETTGWSTDAKRRFFFNSQVRLPAGTPTPASAQLWFQPESGAPEKKVLETRVARR
jgi:hypothetical protein